MPKLLGPIEPEDKKNIKVLGELTPEEIAKISSTQPIATEGIRGQYGMRQAPATLPATPALPSATDQIPTDQLMALSQGQYEMGTPEGNLTQQPQADGIGTMAELANRANIISGEKQRILSQLGGGQGISNIVPSLGAMAVKQISPEEQVKAPAAIVQGLSQLETADLTSPAGWALGIRAMEPFIEKAIPAYRFIPEGTGKTALIAGGAALGSMAGKGVEQIFEDITGQGIPTTDERIKEMADDATLAFGMELGMPWISGKIAGAASKVPKLATQTYEQFKPAADRLIELSKKYLLPMKPSSIVPSKLSKAIEFVGEATVSGNLVGQIKRKQLITGLQNMANDMKLDPSLEPVTVGEQLIGATKGAIEMMRNRTHEAFSKFTGKLIDAYGESGQVPLPNTLRILKENIDKFTPGTKGFNGLSQYMDKMQRSSADGSLTIKEVEQFRKDIWPLTINSNEKAGGEILEGLYSDFDTIDPYLQPMLRHAKNLDVLTRSLKNNKTVQKIIGTEMPEFLVKRAITQNNTSDLLQLKKYISKDDWKTLTNEFLNQMLDKSVSIKGADQVFEPRLFMREFEKMGPQLKKLMPNEYKNIEDFYLVTKSSLDDISEATGRGGELGRLGKMALRVGATGTMGYGALKLSGPAIIIPEGFTAMLTQSLYNPNGIMKALLVNGGKASRLVSERTIKPSGKLISAGSKAVRTGLSKVAPTISRVGVSELNNNQSYAPGEKLLNEMVK